MDIEKIERILVEAGIYDYKLLNPKTDIFVEHWVRLHCMFGCTNYGKSGCCPPAVPSIEECRAIVSEYNCAILIHNRFSFNDYGSYYKEINSFANNLIELERMSFLAGFYKAFLMSFTDCRQCDTCLAEGCREKCQNGKRARPSIEAMGIDVYKTARLAGYNIEVAKNYGDMLDRFAILLLE